LSFEQLAPLLLHLPTLGQLAFVEHLVVSSEQSPLPQSGSEAHALRTLLLQVPIVRQLSGPMQAFPFFAPAPVHLPRVCAHVVLAVQDFDVQLEAPGRPLQFEFWVQTVRLS
jgi:hypothetical protein